MFGRGATYTTSRGLELLGNLTEKQKEYVRLKQIKDKEVSTAYIWWFVFGVHYFYLGRPGMNILYWITFSGFGIWGIIDLFRMKSLVERANEEDLVQYIAEAKIAYPAEKSENKE